jgi:hypothetical protein
MDMSEAPADFGTGLRAHLGLDELELTELDVAIAKVEHTLEPAAEPLQPVVFTAAAPVDAIAAREAALEEREYQLAMREANLAGRAAAILAAAQSLYDSVPATGSVNNETDELARLRRRKTVA